MVLIYFIMNSFRVHYWSKLAFNKCWIFWNINAFNKFLYMLTSTTHGNSKLINNLARHRAIIDDQTFALYTKPCIDYLNWMKFLSLLTPHLSCFCLISLSPHSIIRYFQLITNAIRLQKHQASKTLQQMRSDRLSLEETINKA